jgi:hypothetical protein
MTRGRPGSLRRCTDRLREWSRYEWRINDGGDPVAAVEDFLADNGLPVRNLADRTGDHRPQVCGASLFVSAAAGAFLAGAPVGSPGPAMAVPDLVAVVWAHGALGRALSDGRGPRPSEPWRLSPWRLSPWRLSPWRLSPWRLSPWRLSPWRLSPWRASWDAARHAGAVGEVARGGGRGTPGDLPGGGVPGHSGRAR